jgi:hypothetical protein
MSVNSLPTMDFYYLYLANVSSVCPTSIIFYITQHSKIVLLAHKGLTD